MREIEPTALVPPGYRAVVIAPHPDDEVLGTGGLLARLAGVKCEILIVALTDGEASHPGSTRWPPSLLARQRANERREALKRLGVEEVRVVRTKRPDGALSADEDALLNVLSRLIRSDDVVFVPWRCDGHPDHEAAAHAALRLTLESGAKLVEVPIWMWHWAVPDDRRVPWSRARRVCLDTALLARKERAVAAYASQIEADPSTERGAVLAATTLARLLRPFEVVFV
jgi:LmbE family N-acetylglucosaminyl deacetylase